MNDMEHCTEKTERWPDAFSKVSPDKMDQFLIHTEVCAFHARMLEAIEKEALAGFCLAQAFEGHGRVLEDPALSETIKELDRRNATFHQVAAEREFPFNYISLTNCDEIISSGGKFLDFESVHVSKCELSWRDVKAGLQIWGVISEKPDVKIPLGAYPLAGVRHNGEEKLLPINDNYVIGLRVSELGNRTFQFVFRCVEAKALAREKAMARRLVEIENGETSEGPGFGKSFWAPIVTKIRNYGVVAASIFIRTPARSQLAAGATIGLFLICASNTVHHLIGGYETPMIVAATSNNRANGQQVEVSKTIPEATTLMVDVRGSEARAVTHKVDTPARVVETRNQSERSQAAVVKPDKPVMLTSNHSSQPQANESTAVNQQQRWLFQTILKESAVGGRNFILHSGSDSVLQEKLFAEMRQRDVPVFALQNNVCFLKPQPFEVRWSITRDDKSVTVRADFIGNDGASESVEVSSEGTCVDDACEKAVRSAVSNLLAVMQGQTKDAFGS
jgi:hypothetical protein